MHCTTFLILFILYLFVDWYLSCIHSTTLWMEMVSITRIFNGLSFFFSLSFSYFISLFFCSLLFSSFYCVASYRPSQPLSLFILSFFRFLVLFISIFGIYQIVVTYTNNDKHQQIIFELGLRLGVNLRNESSVN